MNALEGFKGLLTDQIADCRKKKTYLGIMKNQALLNYFDGQIKAYENVICFLAGADPIPDGIEIGEAAHIENDPDLNIWR